MFWRNSDTGLSPAKELACLRKAAPAEAGSASRSDIGHQISISHRFRFRFRISQPQPWPQPRVSFSCLRSVVLLSEPQNVQKSA